MSDSLVVYNRIQMKLFYGIRVGCGLEITRQSSSALCALIQALFACEEFRIKIIMIARYNSRLFVYDNLRHIFQHMVIGKQSSLIPTGFKQVLPNVDENDVISIFEGLIKLIANDYPYREAEDVNDNDRPATEEDSDWSENERDNNTGYVIVPNCASETFQMRFTYKCVNKCNIDNNEMWFTTLEIDAQHQQPIDIQEEFRRQVIGTHYLIHSNSGCPQCKARVDCEVKKPNTLIIQLTKHQSLFTDIKCQTNDIIVMDKHPNYSLFACICYDQYEQYTCYAKLDKMWCSFKGRYVQEIPVLTVLNNVCILFYKKNPSDDYSIFSKQVDTTGVIPPLDLSSDVHEIELKQSFETVKYTDNDLIIDDMFDIQYTGLPNREGIVNESGVCFMNAVLQSLYHCIVFRKYILECNNRFGEYHAHLKSLFIAMNDRDVKSVAECHEKFRVLLRRKYKKYSSLIFYRHLIEYLHKEVQDLYVRQKQFDPTNSSERDYSDVLIGREDMSSSDSWMQYMIENDNSYVKNMFINQRIETKRCRSGHKTLLTFKHCLDVIHPKNNLTSLQDIVNYYGRFKHTPNSTCNSCQSYNSMYSIGKYSIYRASDILVFNFRATKVKPYVFVKPNMELEEYLYVCGNIYRCVAVMVSVESPPPPPGNERVPGHGYAIARCDDGFMWWVFNDTRVRPYRQGMPQNSKLDLNEYIYLAFYEKESAYIEIQVRNELSFENRKSFDDIDVRESGIHYNTHLNPLSLLASNVGVINLYGNTSYMNSVLQSLYHCFEFRKYIIFDQQCYDCKTIHYQLKHLFVNLSCTDYSTVNPEVFRKVFIAKHIQFDRRGDPKSFLIAIIEDILNECIDEWKFEECPHYKDINAIIADSWSAGMRSPFSVNVNLNIVNLFGVIYRTQQYCKSRRHSKVNFEQKYFIGLSCIGVGVTQSIQSLIDAHLMDSNSKTMKCNEKKCKFQTELSETLYRVPNILIIVLKIFIHENTRKRINHFIDISESIVVNTEQLTLRSYICCNGSEPKSLHYYCYAKSNDSKTYYCFDDDIVELSDHRQRKKNFPNSYILFYEKI